MTLCAPVVIKDNVTIDNDLEGLKNASPERWKAAHKCSRCNGFGYTDKETGDFIYTNNIYFECIQEFQKYISRIRTENIEMYHSFDGDPVFAQAVCPIKLVHLSGKAGGNKSGLSGNLGGPAGNI